MQQFPEKQAGHWSPLFRPDPRQIFLGEHDDSRVRFLQARCCSCLQLTVMGHWRQVVLTRVCAVKCVILRLYYCWMTDELPWPLHTITVSCSTLLVHPATSYYCQTGAKEWWPLTGLSGLFFRKLLQVRRERKCLPNKHLSGFLMQSFLQVRRPSCHPTKSVNAPKE